MTIEYKNITENRTFKDSLFRIVFQDKTDLLDLYNAINGTNYSNPADLEINTLENVLYLSIKNDISFIIGCTLNLYEHQSTENENMPLRGLFYFSRLYEHYVDFNGLDIYRKNNLELPTPQYIIFYNGTNEEPDQRTMKLSDSFVSPGGCLECKATLLNINYGHNKTLMEKCRKLEEYAIFVATVRKHLLETNSDRKIAITLAMNECIDKGILEDILSKQRNEVLGMILSTFNKELYEKGLKEDATEDTAVRMLKSGKLTFEEIAEYTNLPLKTIEKLQKKL